MMLRVCGVFSHPCMRQCFIIVLKKIKIFQQRAYLVLCQHGSTVLMPAWHVTAYTVLWHDNHCYRSMWAFWEWSDIFVSCTLSFFSLLISTSSWTAEKADGTGIRWTARNFVLLSRCFAINPSSSLYCVSSKDSTHHPNRVNPVPN